MDFTTWSMALYARPQVEACCLRLQDEYGLDVNVVLFCHWYGACGGVMDDALWRRIEEISEQCRNRLVRPLREARRWLKGPVFEPEEDRLRLRERIKEDELAAELLQQKWMQRAAEDSSPRRQLEPAAATRRNVEALLQRHGIALTDEIRELLEVISRAVESPV